MRLSLMFLNGNLIIKNTMRIKQMSIMLLYFTLYVSNWLIFVDSFYSSLT